MFIPYLVCFYLGVTLPKLLAIKPLHRLFQSAVLALCVLLFRSIYVYGNKPRLHIDFYGYLVVSVFISGWLVAYGGGEQARSVTAVVAASRLARGYIVQLLCLWNADHDVGRARHVPITSSKLAHK